MYIYYYRSAIIILYITMENFATNLAQFKRCQSFVQILRNVYTK